MLEGIISFFNNSKNSPDIKIKKITETIPDCKYAAIYSSATLYLITLLSLLYLLWIEIISKWAIISSILGKFYDMVKIRYLKKIDKKQHDLMTEVEQIKAFTNQIVDQLEVSANQQRRMKTELITLTQLVEQQKLMMLDFDTSYADVEFSELQSQICSLEASMADHEVLLQQYLAESRDSLLKNDDLDLSKCRDKGCLNYNIQPSKSLSKTLQSTMAEFVQEARNQLIKEREEVVEDTKTLVAAVVEERAEIVCMVQQAFEALSEQSLQYYAKLGFIGQETFESISAVQSQLATEASKRFSEIDSKLKYISKKMKNLTVDIGEVKISLNSIDVNIEKVYNVFDVRKETNLKENKQMAKLLKLTTEDWGGKAGTVENLVDKIQSIVGETNDPTESNRSEQHDVSKVQTQAVDRQILRLTKENVAACNLLFEQKAFNVLPTIIGACANKVDTLNAMIDEGMVDFKSVILDFHNKLDNFASATQTMIDTRRSPNSVSSRTGTLVNMCVDTLRKLQRQHNQDNVKDNATACSTTQTMMDSRTTQTMLDCDETCELLEVKENASERASQGEFIVHKGVKKLSLSVVRKNIRRKGVTSSKPKLGSPSKIDNVQQRKTPVTTHRPAKSRRFRAKSNHSMNTEVNNDCTSLDENMHFSEARTQREEEN